MCQICAASFRRGRASCTAAEVGFRSLQSQSPKRLSTGQLSQRDRGALLEKLGFMPATRHAKILFVNEDGDENRIRMDNFWTRHSQHSTNEMKEQRNERLRVSKQINQPKGFTKYVEREEAASNKLAVLADAKIEHLEAFRLFDIAFLERNNDIRPDMRARSLEN